MRTVPGYETKEVRLMTAGELALGEFHAGFSLALALNEPHPSRRFFCVIPLDTSVPPYLHQAQLGSATADVYCYGTDWVLEAQPDRSSVGGRQRGEVSGAITLSPDGPLLSVDNGYGERHSTLQLINLKTAKIYDGVFRDWVTFDWRIWNSADERQSRHGSPLYESALTSRMASA